MKKLNKKFAVLSAVVMTNLFCLAAFAEEANFNDISTPVVNLVNQLLNPLLAIVGALGALYCIVLGVKYAKAEDPQEQMKAKHALKNAVIGFVLIFVLIVAMRVSMPILTTWVNESTKNVTPATLNN